MTPLKSFYTITLYLQNNRQLADYGILRLNLTMQVSTGHIGSVPE